MSSSIDKALKSGITIFKDNENKLNLIKSLKKCKNDVEKSHANHNMAFDVNLNELDQIIKSIENLCSACYESRGCSYSCLMLL